MIAKFETRGLRVSPFLPFLFLHVSLLFFFVELDHFSLSLDRFLTGLMLYFFYKKNAQNSVVFLIPLWEALGPICSYFVFLL